MKNANISNQIRIVGVKRATARTRCIDMYLEGPHTPRTYAFTRKYSDGVYALCKSGIRANALLGTRSESIPVTKFIEQARRVIPDILDDISAYHACA